MISWLTDYRIPPSRRVLIATLTIALVAVVSTHAAPPGSGESEVAALLDTRDGVALLRDVEDGTFAFDDEGFYWFCNYLRNRAAVLSDSTCGDDELVPWQYLMERPGDYRGQVVCIEGRFLREQPSYDIATRPETGRLRQVDLGVSGSNAIATIVLVDPIPRIPKRSLIRVKGFFIKIRGFRTESGDEGAGPLFVARSVIITESQGAESPRPGGLTGRDMLTAMAGIVIVLFFVSVLVRRRVGHVADATSTPFERRRTTGSKADFDWMNDESAASPGRDDGAEG